MTVFTRESVCRIKVLLPVMANQQKSGHMGIIVGDAQDLRLHLLK